MNDNDPNARIELVAPALEMLYNMLSTMEKTFKAYGIDGADEFEALRNKL